jgi:Photosynthetic reaction centre cytochrome C subunit
VNALAVAGILSFAQALGVDCVHCHVQDDWSNASKAPYETARRMSEMVRTVNAGPLAGLKEIECWTCHSGQPQPARLPVASWRAVQIDWPASLPDSPEQLKLAMSVYSASLGVDCGYCHSPSDWRSDAKPPFRMVARMNAMFELFPAFMPPTARTQCFMCHKGATSPSRRTP